MTYFVYMLIAVKFSRFFTYVGYTKNLKKRLELHNKSKGAKYTKGKKWNIIYKKKYLSKSKAMKEEYILKKNYTLRNEIKKKYLKKNA
jgi:putative endonuclease